MKRFYVAFLAGSLLIFTLLYFSIWWFLSGLATFMIFLAYRFYAIRLRASTVKNEQLEKKMDELYLQLDRSILNEQKTGREAEQVKALKHQLLTILGHEIRTPMNGVMGMSLLLADTSLTQEQKEYNDTIRRCGVSLLTTVNDILVNEILDFSKLDQESIKLDSKDFDLRNCVEEVLEMFAGKAGKAGLELMYSMDENVPEQIVADSRRLRQVLMNLIENAVKFTHAGEVFLGIHLSDKGAVSQPELVFEVRDTGIGIANDQLRQLFSGIPGKEGPKEVEAKSSGLGLVICRKLVELMEGRIEVKSHLEQGSTFTFSIPFVPNLKPVREHIQLNNIVNLKNKCILVVDDNVSSRDILIKQLISWNMVPVGAESGKHALEILSQHAGIDLIITDMKMPGMDGIQLAELLRGQYPAIPLILMGPPVHELFKVETVMFSTVLVKPIRQQILKDHLVGVFSQTTTEMKNPGNQFQQDFAKQYPLRILVAEDNPINQKLAMKILTKLGYQPSLANNGKEVMEMISHDHFDIILMDVQMPEMNGLEATRMIRTCLGIQPVIIALTANAMQGDRDDCMQAGMDDYMSKPIELKELLTQLEKWALEIGNKRRA